MRFARLGAFKLIASLVVLALVFAMAAACGNGGSDSGGGSGGSGGSGGGGGGGGGAAQDVPDEILKALWRRLPVRSRRSPSLWS